MKKHITLMLVILLLQLKETTGQSFFNELDYSQEFSDVEFTGDLKYVILTGEVFNIQKKIYEPSNKLVVWKNDTLLNFTIFTLSGDSLLKLLKSYDPQGRCIGDHLLNWDKVKKRWLTDVKYVYKYNRQGKEYEVNLYKSDSSGTGIELKRIVRREEKYDSSGRLIEMTAMEYMYNEWKKGAFENYHYTGNNTIYDSITFSGYYDWETGKYRNPGKAIVKEVTGDRVYEYMEILYDDKGYSTTNLIKLYKNDSADVRELYSLHPIEKVFELRERKSKYTEGNNKVTISYWPSYKEDKWVSYLDIYGREYGAEEYIMVNGQWDSYYKRLEEKFFDENGNLDYVINSTWEDDTLNSSTRYIVDSTVPVITEAEYNVDVLNKNPVITAFPNPAQNSFAVSAAEQLSGDLQLFNCNGQKVKEIRNYQSGDDIDASELLTGVYFVNLKSEANVHRQIIQICR